MLPSIQFILVSFLSHQGMVKFQTTMLLVDVVVCLGHDFGALWHLVSVEFEPCENHKATNGISMLVFGLEFWYLIPAQNPEVPVVVCQWYLDYQEIPNAQSHKTCAVQANLPLSPDGKWKHAVSHVPRVYAFGHGNTSSRTRLIILVFVDLALLMQSHKAKPPQTALKLNCQCNWVLCFNFFP